MSTDTKKTTEKSKAYAAKAAIASAKFRAIRSGAYKGKKGAKPSVMILRHSDGQLVAG